jgi:RNA polymerase sigma-70 factor (ECF subfamily)
MDASEPEAELIAQAIVGDRAAIQQLLVRHHDRLVGAIERKVPPDLRGVLAGEDICQETYVAVYRQIMSFQPQGERAFYRWLLTIAQRKLVDAVRTLRAAKRGGDMKARGFVGDAEAASMVELLDVVAVHERTPSRSVAHRELVVQVRDAVDQLRDDYRDALRLRYIQNLSVAETAEQMGRTEGAVMMLCRRGLRRLAKVLGDPSRFFSRTA